MAYVCFAGKRVSVLACFVSRGDGDGESVRAQSVLLACSVLQVYE